MKEPTKEKWLELCDAAGKEHEPQKLLLLIEEINRLIEEKDDRLERRDSAASGLLLLGGSTFHRRVLGAIVRCEAVVELPLKIVG